MFFLSEMAASAEEESVDFGASDEECLPPTADGREARDKNPGEAMGSETRDQKKIFRPARVEKVLKTSKSFDEFRRNRKFTMLHLYAGPKDVLFQAVEREAKANRLETYCLSLDKKMDKDLNLADPEKHKILLEEVNNGEFDYVHSGFPCSSFSRARHSENPGPPAVRSKAEIYGLAGNSVNQQKEADTGTLMACQSAELYKAQVRSCEARKIPSASTLENPPGDNVSGGAWDLPELEAAIQDTKGEKIFYNTCAFQTKSKARSFKPGIFGGKLEGIKEVNRVCRCPEWVKHRALVGKTRTEAAGEYPTELCEVIAKAVVATWKRVANLEWWRYQVETKEGQVGDLQKAWLTNEGKKAAGETPVRKSSRAASIAAKIESMEEGSSPAGKGEKRKMSVAFERGDVEKDNLPSSSKQPPKKKIRELHNDWCIGGMRNPAYSIARLSLVKETGQKMRKLWDEFMEAHPEAVLVAKRYGRPDNSFDQELVKLWKDVLKDHLVKIRDDGLTLRESYEFKSPLDASLWEAWQKESCDPDNCIADFIRFGVPLGMERPIPPSNIFPKVLEPEEKNQDPLETFELLKEVKNYKSVRDQPQEAGIEIQRYLDKKFCVRVSWEWVEANLHSGTTSKMALILKEKPDGSTKRRIILDLRRSMGNSRSEVGERIVLPRLVDVVAMLRALWKTKVPKPTGEEDDFEFACIDLSDAFCHFSVHKDELRHCVSPNENGDGALLWTAMLFGFKAAPLLMGRLSAALGRLLSSLARPSEAQLQVYIDDVIIGLTGDKDSREQLLACFLMTAAAFGVQINLKKGERGRRTQWIGCTIEVPLAEGTQPDTVVLSVASQMVESVVEALTSWQGRGMASVKDLRSVTGRLSWMAGVIPRMRWVVNVFYGTLSQVDREQAPGQEEKRSTNRSDPRDKTGLFHVKRLGGADQWMLKLLQAPGGKLVRVENLHQPPVSRGIITDASPKGWGAILVKVHDAEGEDLEPIDAVEAMITKEEAELLAVEFGEASSQAVMETYAILRAIDKWGREFTGRGVLIRSDSTVALAMMQRLSSTNSVLNYLAAEISLRLEIYEVQRLVCHHLRGAWNVEADWLSRLAERGDKPKPSGLDGVPLKRAGPWTAPEKFLLPPPGHKLPEGKVRFAPADSVFGSLMWKQQFCMTAEGNRKCKLVGFL